jgi:hypothetical protein
MGLGFMSVAIVAGYEQALAFGENNQGWVWNPDRRRQCSEGLRFCGSNASLREGVEAA